MARSTTRSLAGKAASAAREGGVAPVPGPPEPPPTAPPRPPRRQHRPRRPRRSTRLPRPRRRPAKKAGGVAAAALVTVAVFLAGAALVAALVVVDAAVPRLPTTLRAAEAALPARDRVLLRTMDTFRGGGRGTRSVRTTIGATSSPGEGIARSTLAQSRHAGRDATASAEGVCRAPHQTPNGRHPQVPTVRESRGGSSALVLAEDRAQPLGRAAAVGVASRVGRAGASSASSCWVK